MEYNERIHQHIREYGHQLEPIIKETLRNEEVHIAHFYDVEEERVIEVDYTIPDNTDYIVGGWSGTISIEEYTKAYGKDSIPKSWQLKNLPLSLIGEDDFNYSVRVKHLERVLVPLLDTVVPKEEPISMSILVKTVLSGKPVYMKDPATGKVTKLGDKAQIPVTALNNEFYLTDVSHNKTKQMLCHFSLNVGKYCAYLSDEEAYHNLNMLSSKSGQGYFVGMTDSLQLVCLDAKYVQYNNVTNRLQTSKDIKDGEVYPYSKMVLANACDPIKPLVYKGGI